MTNRRDVKLGKVEPKQIENGIVSPPNMQINEETLAEHQRRIVSQGYRPLRIDEAAPYYNGDEVADYFGD